MKTTFYYYKIMLVITGLLCCVFASMAQVNVQWDKTFGGNGGGDLSSVTSDSDGGYLLAGTSNSDASYNKTEDSKGGEDYWIIKVIETEEENSSAKAAGKDKKGEEKLYEELLEVEEEAYLVYPVPTTLQE